MDSGITARQQGLGLDLPSGIAIIGAGGVGSWCAILAALAGVQEIWLFDPDRISEHNLNRIPLPMSAVGFSKSDALAAHIAMLRPDCHLIPQGRFTPELAKALLLDMRVSWVVVTTDTHDSRQMVHKWATTELVAYIEAAAEGDVGSATGAPAEFRTPEETQPGYQSVPVWAGPCVMAAALAMSHVLHGRPMDDRTIRLGFVSDEFQVFDSAREERLQHEPQ